LLRRLGVFGLEQHGEPARAFQREAPPVVLQECVDVDGPPGEHREPLGPLSRRVRQLGANLGVNLDPSHFFWQSMDPFAMVEAIGDRIGHAHGKDTTLHAQHLALNGMLDSRWPNPPDEMPWNFATVGRGHDKEWWRKFVGLLRDHGFAGTISIEYEDPFVPVDESVLESARLLSSVVDS